MVALWCPCPGRKADDNKRTQLRYAREGVRHEYRRQPRRVKHTRRIPRLWRGRETVEKKGKEERKLREEETANLARMLRWCAEGNIYERGWVLRVSATVRNCTGWGTLIYWVITDPSTRASAWCMGFLRPREESLEI